MTKRSSGGQTSKTPRGRRNALISPGPYKKVGGRRISEATTPVRDSSLADLIGPGDALFLTGLAAEPNLGLPYQNSMKV